jgi:hypothetical protein
VAALTAAALLFAGSATAKPLSPLRPGPLTVTRTVTDAVAPVFSTAAPPGSPVLVTSMDKAPSGYRLTPRQVLHIAGADPLVQAQLRNHPLWEPYEYTRGPGQWQVSWFTHAKPQKEAMQVYVDDATGQVEQSWTGFQVAWTMARGYPGAFGRQVNAWYLWLPFSVLFVVPFLPWRRQAGSRRLSLFVLDLLMLLGFSISLAFFNNAKIGLSVPLVYPFLIYLLVRMLLLANGRGLPRRPLHTAVPMSWLGIGTVFLMAFRIGLNVLNSNVIDVGYAGVIGADKLIHGVPLYGNWPLDNRYGDTYGPVSYYLYVPFRLIFGWSGHWDSLPAAHAAAIFFDLVTVGALFLLGRRLRGNSLGLTLAYLWAAYPFTLYAMNSNTNDSLVAATVVISLLVISSPPARGAMAAVAGLTKFAPFALAPLLLRGVGERPPREKSVAAFVLAFGVTVFVLMLPVVLNGDLSYFWHDSFQYQSDRITPFSIWGLWGGLGGLQHLLQGAVIAFALGVYFLPSRRGLMEVAALGAALLVGLQITLNYWLYPYIVWFYPLVIFALLAAHPERNGDAPQQLPAPSRSLEREPIRIQIVT